MASGSSTSRWTGRRRFRTLAAFAVVGTVFCAGPPEDEPVAGGGSVIVAPEDIVIAQPGEIRTGPLLSGSLEPARSATVSAEIGGAVLGVGAEPGENVAAGAVIVQIDDAALQDDVLSAQTAANAAEQSATVARRNAERSRTLFEAGAIAQRAFEDARLAAENAESQVTAAHARLAQAENQRAKTTVRAPFTGVVSARPVHAGDVVQPGSTLFTLVDPTSMRLEAAVPSTDLGAVQVGALAEFNVTGYGGRVFVGKVTRVSPTVDPVTRQVTVYVSLPNDEGELVGGLYAEGMLAARTRAGLLLPLDAVDDATQPPTVIRVRAGRVEQVPVVTGLRDDRQERIEVAQGLAEGDTVLVGAARELPPGTPVRLRPSGGYRPATPGP